MPVRYASGRWAATWLSFLDRLFWLPTRLMARATGMAGRGETGATTRAVNDNLAVLAARPANSNTPRRLA